MPALERNSLLLESRQRLFVADTRPVEKPILGVGSVVSRLLAAELKTRRGQQPVWLTFWVCGVAVSGFIGVLYGVALYMATAAVQEAFLVVLAAYTAWILISIWRCTEGTQYFSGVLARFLVVPWAANVTLVLAFTQLELLLQFLDAGSQLSQAGPS